MSVGCNFARVHINLCIVLYIKRLHTFIWVEWKVAQVFWVLVSRVQEEKNESWIFPCLHCHTNIYFCRISSHLVCILRLYTTGDWERWNGSNDLCRIYCTNHKYVDTINTWGSVAPPLPRYAEVVLSLMQTVVDLQWLGISLCLTWDFKKIPVLSFVSTVAPSLRRHWTQLLVVALEAAGGPPPSQDRT